MDVNEYNEGFIDMAITVSKKATCDRRHVGCIVTLDGRYQGAGYNDSPKNTNNCYEAGHVMYEGSCKRTIHAEVNACIDALKRTNDLTGAVVYVTDQPCSDCLKFMTNLGISKVFYMHDYPFKYEVETDIEMVKVKYDLYV